MTDITGTAMTHQNTLAAEFPDSGAMKQHLDTVRRGRLLLGRLDLWLVDEIREHLGSRVLDIGCGHGNLLSLMLDRDLVIGTDIDPESVALVRERFKNRSNVRAHLFDVLQKPGRELIEYDVDTIISLNVLEHIEQDDIAIENMLKLFRHEGTLILVVPASMRLYGPMDSAIGHYRRYDMQSMRNLLECRGAQINRQFYHNIVGALGWWFSGRVLRCQTPPDGQLALFDRLVPLLARFERLIRPSFGLSLVTVAKWRP